MAKSLQQYLKGLEQAQSPELVNINARVIPHRFEVTALLEKMDQREDSRVAWFRNIVNNHDKSTDFSIASNVFGSRERIGTQIGLSEEGGGMEVSIHYAQKELEKIESERISSEDAPVKENLRTGNDIDLLELPVVRHFEMDLSPVLTMMAVMKHPDEGFYDVSFVKVFPKGPDEAGISIHSPHLERILQRYEELGIDAPVVSILGHHPAFTLGTACKAPYGNDDYSTIGAFMQEPVRLVPSETWGEEFLVPADAEILLEGVIPPGAKAVVDPFGEVTRDYQPQCIRQLLKVKAITWRNRAVLQDIFSGHPEHWLLGGIAKEGGLFNMLKRQFGNVTAVKMPFSGCSRLEAHIAIKKRNEDEAKNIAMAAIGFDAMLQWIVIVDEDIDPFNELDVRWAVNNYVNPERDIMKVRARNVFYNAGAGWKVIIDATKPFTGRPSAVRFRVPPDVMERMNLDDYLT